jgi:hypothetical protein
LPGRDAALKARRGGLGNPHRESLALGEKATNIWGPSEVGEHNYVITIVYDTLFFHIWMGFVSATYNWRAPSCGRDGFLTGRRSHRGPVNIEIS